MSAVPSDFNDLAKQRGHHAIKACIDNARGMCDYVELIDASQLKPAPIHWLWPGWLARGKLHVLAGAPGTGKTTIAMDIAACVSAGRGLPSGFTPLRGNVIVWTGEDDPADTLVPRLLAAGADLGRIRFVGDVREAGEARLFDPSRDVQKLALAIAEMSEVSLLVVDPLVSAVGGDSHKNAEVRRGLAPLVGLASSQGVALLGITHYSKGTQGREPLERVTGSVAFGALARVVLGTTRGKDEEGGMTLARCKSNIGPDGGGFAYAFEQTQLADHNGIEASRIVWGAALEGSARELLGEPEDEASDSENAADFLQDILEPGPLGAKDVFKEAENAGYSRDQIKRAKRRLRVTSGKASMTSPWLWRLPEPEGSAEGCEGSTQNRARPSLPSEAKPLPSGDEMEGFEL